MLRSIVARNDTYASACMARVSVGERSFREGSTVVADAKNTPTLRSDLGPSVGTSERQRSKRANNVSHRLAVACTANQGRHWQAALSELALLDPNDLTEPQSLNFHLYSGLAQAQLDHPSQAEQSFRSALAVIGPYGNELTRAKVLYHLALALNDQQRFLEASHEHWKSIAALDRYGRPKDKECNDLRFENLRRLAGQMLILLQLQEGLDCLNTALELSEPTNAPHTEQLQRRQITVLWMMALMFRWNGALQAAYSSAKKAVTIYRALVSSPIYKYDNVYDDKEALTLARLLLVAADSAIECVPQAQDANEVKDLLKIARMWIADARQNLQSAPYLSATPGKKGLDDPAGEVLATLAALRCDRVSGQNNRYERHQELKRQLQAANLLQDNILIGQAHLALGDEWSSRGLATRAAKCYQNALVYLTPDAPMLAMRARKALGS